MTATITIPAAAFLAMVAMVPRRRPTVAQLRRLAACRGVRSFRRGDQLLAVKWASRVELLTLLGVEG